MTQLIASKQIELSSPSSSHGSRDILVRDILVPVRCTNTYFGGGTPYRQLLLSQWRYTYAEQLVRLMSSKCAKSQHSYSHRCVSQAQNAPIFVFGRKQPRIPVGELTKLPQTTQSAGKGTSSPRFRFPRRLWRLHRPTRRLRWASTDNMPKTYSSFSTSEAQRRSKPIDPLLLLLQLLLTRQNKKAQLTQRERATAVHVKGLKAHCEQM